MKFDFSSTQGEEVKEDVKAQESLKVPSLRKKPEKSRRTLLGVPQSYEKLAAKQETDILLTCPICNVRRVRLECFIMSCPMYDSHKFYCGECPESEHT
jgi:hypothetical protein